MKKYENLFNELPLEDKIEVLSVRGNYGKVKWCHTLGCNKRATNFIDKLTDVHPNELRYVGYCYGHYIRAVNNCR